jgi:hypothetical protein
VDVIATHFQRRLLNTTITLIEESSKYPHLDIRMSEQESEQEKSVAINNLLKIRINGKSMFLLIKLVNIFIKSSIFSIHL